MRTESLVFSKRSWGFLLLSVFLLGSFQVSASAQEAWTPATEGFPTTSFEQSGYQTNTNYVDMWAFLDGLSAASTDMRLGTYGKTREGRELPLAIFSKPLVSEPWEAWALGRPIVLLSANVHGGERTFREGLLILARDLATPGTAANDLLDKVTVLVAPQLNPDGYEASDRGSRGNSWGIDLNRDYVKIEQPTLANYVTNLLGEWRPHMFVDSHNGGSRPYNLCYQCASHYDPAREITLLCDNEIFPSIDALMESEGMRSWYYSGGDEESWRVGGDQARIGRNYGGFINSVGILFEAPGQEAEKGARAGYLGNLAVVEYAVNNSAKLMKVVADARAETIALGAEPRGEIAVQMEYGPEDYTVDYTIITGGGRGAAANAPVDTVEVTGAQLMKKPIPTQTRARPFAYILPRDAEQAVALLRRHGITVEVLTESDSLTVDAYTVAGVSYERAYNHAAATRVEVGEVVTLEQNFPKGTYIVPTAQFLGRLAAHMLEPETDDNVVYWNTMDAWIPRPAEEPVEAQLPPGVDPNDPRVAQFRRRQANRGPAVVPIYKLMTSQPLPTRLVGGK